LLFWAVLNSCLVELAGDGVYSIQEGGFIQLVDLKINSTRNLVATSDIKDVSYQTSSRAPTY
jgi:hypothetical protein